MRRAWLLVVCCACTAVDTDLLGPRPTPCALGEVGAWIDVTPAGVAQVDPDPGVRGIALDRLNPSVLYATSHAQGIWRSGDCGATWVHTNTGINGPVIERALPIDVEVDPVVPDTLYVTPRFGGNSVWSSSNAGVHWSNLIPPAVAMPLYDSDLADLGELATFPDEAHHLLASSMVPWVGFGSDAGLLEGRLVDDAWQWTVHPPAPGMGVAQGIAVLDARTWLISSTYVPSGEGTWITRDAGATFTRVDDHEATGGGWAVYRGPDGTLYRPSQDGLLRSTDAGDTWIDVFTGLGFGGAQAVVGNGTTLYVSSGVPDGSDGHRLYTAAEQPGDRGWTIVDRTTSTSFARFERDPVRDVVYGWNAFGGIQRLRQR